MHSTEHTIYQTQDQALRFDFDLPTLIVGMGKTGVSCARFLQQNNTLFAMADSSSTPSKLESISNEFPGITLLTGNFQLELFLDYQQFIVSPGISIRKNLFQQLAQQGKLIIGDIELFAQVVDKPVIAITGSNGKTTVTTLVASIANACGIKALAGGNLGVPALDLLAADCDLYILELSSFQLETTRSLKTLSACVLNVSEDHMDRYDHINDYRQIKETIYEHCEYKVINRQEVEIMAEFPDDNIILFGAESANDDEYGIELKDGKTCLTKGRNVLLKDDQIRLKGRFNYLNILAAMALMEPLHVDEECLLGAIKSFKGLPHRCEWTAEINAVDYYNDSKGTNPGATIAAIDSFSEPEILIAGGVGKEADFSKLGGLISRKIKAVVLMGVDAPLIQIAAEKAGLKSELIYRVNSMQQAVSMAYKLSSPGDVVIFSPACASFDMYHNYVERGDDFKRQVLDLKLLMQDSKDGLDKKQAGCSQAISDQNGVQNAG